MLSAEKRVRICPSYSTAYPCLDVPSLLDARLRINGASIVVTLRTEECKVDKAQRTANGNAECAGARKFEAACGKHPGPGAGSRFTFGT